MFWTPLPLSGGTPHVAMCVDSQEKDSASSLECSSAEMGGDPGLGACLVAWR